MLGCDVAGTAEAAPGRAANPWLAAADENVSVENRWCLLRDTLQSTALAVLCRAPRQPQDWFDNYDAAIRSLLAEKNRLHKAYVNHPTDDNRAAFYRSRRHLQQHMREMQDAWTARKAEEIQGYADRNEWKNFFSAIKAVYGPPTKGTAPLLSAYGSTLRTEKTQILQRWAEHFRGVLNRPSVISDAAIARLPQVATNVDLDFPPSLQETIRAVQQLCSGKAPGSDAIPAEVYKHGGPQLMNHLTGLFQEMWRQGEFPQDFKDATVVHIYKLQSPRHLLARKSPGRTASNVSSVSKDIPGTNWTYWTHSDQVQRSDRTNRRLSARLFLASLTPTNSDYSSEPPIPSSSSYSSSSSSPSSATYSSSSTAAALVAVTHASITHIHDAPTSESRIEDQDHTCPHCDRTFTSHIELVGH
nr:unnamed protein product [Spirometra erinaceieuropaei]